MIINERKKKNLINYNKKVELQTTQIEILILLASVESYLEQRREKFTRLK